MENKFEGQEGERASAETADQRRSRQAARRQQQLEEPWQRQPKLRELQRHPFVSIEQADQRPDFDALMIAFEEHVSV